MSKSYGSDWPEGCQNWASLKVWFLPCEIDFFMLARLGFFFEKINVRQPKRGPWSGPGRPRGPFPNFKGGPRDPKVARPLSKRGLGGALGPSRDEKHRNGDEQCVFKIVKIRLVFIAFLDRSLRQSVRNATEGMKNRRSAERSETLACSRGTVGDPGSPRREPWRVPGRTSRVQEAIPGRQGVLLHCLTVLLWVPDIHWGG